MRRFLAFLLPAILLMPAPAHAWGDKGHQIVARIAAHQLTPAALKAVADLLEVEPTPEAVADALAAASTWADQVKAKTNTAPWHFIDLAWQDNRANIPDRCQNDECAPAQIKIFAAQLKANNPDAKTRFSDEEALRFLVHLVADVHQPLHATTNADRGGNCVALADWVDHAENLHALWDGPLVSRLGSDDVSIAAALTAELAQSSESDKADAAAGDVDDWAWESHRLGLQHIYKRLEIPKEEIAFPTSCDQAPEEIQQLQLVIEDQYLEDMQPVVREQLKKAGLRLGQMLNNILPSEEDQ